MSDDPETPADERDEAAEAPTPEDFEQDPARNPDDERLKDIKGG
jgi:hypothetical protein